MKTSNFSDSDLIYVYDLEGHIVGHMWYSTFVKIHGEDVDDYRIEYSDWNGADNIADYEAHHRL